MKKKIFSSALALIMAGIVAAEVTVIFLFVYFVIWLNERRIAKAFNRELAELQARKGN